MLNSETYGSMIDQFPYCVLYNLEIPADKI
jgi:hypothetical protein